MPTVLEPMIAELKMEAETTRRVLDRIPEGQLSWRPHPKSMTLGQLAMHIALIPGALSKVAGADEFDVANAKFEPPMPKDKAEVLATLDGSVSDACAYLGGLNDAAAFATWRMVASGKEIMSMPRIAMLRTIMFNHWYHHRGQFSVYLRMLEIPVPSIYGPSADDNPFKAMMTAA